MTLYDHDNHYAMQWSSSSWKLIINCNVQWILKMKMSHVAKRIKYCIVKTVHIAKGQLYSFFCCSLMLMLLCCSIFNVYVCGMHNVKYNWRNLKTLINSQHNIFLWIIFGKCNKILNNYSFTIYYNFFVHWLRCVMYVLCYAFWKIKTIY